MAEWQAELETLLSHLHVSLEHEPVISRNDSAATHRLAEDGAISDVSIVPMREDEVIASDVIPMDDDEVTAVRSEIEATLRRVVALTQVGKLDPHVRDDVIFVLQALTRPQPRGSRRSRPRGPGDSSSEWQLASAAAVLHFCRIVLRMTQAVAAEPEP